MRSFKFYLFKYVLRLILKRPITTLKKLKSTRTQGNRQEKNKLPDGVRVKSLMMGTTTGELYEPHHLRSSHTLFYIHGGGFCLGSLGAYRTYLMHLARGLGMRIITPDYSLSPEHPFPVALNQIFEAYKDLALTEKDAKNIVVGGDSAGAGLALSLLLKAREELLDLPSTALLFSPWIDLTLSGDSFEHNKKSDHYLHVESTKSFVSWYTNGADPKAPLISPLWASLKGLPSLFIQYSDTELIASDGERLGEKAKNDGVSVATSVLKDMPHAAIILYPILKEATDAFAAAESFLVERKILSPTPHFEAPEKRVIKREE
jgi:monoterpene epsilon-lactone hydrolase